MQSLRLRIPGPSALLTFEAAARHLSFSRAAEELRVSQAAVSSAVKNLENGLGVTLFIREHKRVVLTIAGRRFYTDVAMGLGHIARSAEAIQELARDRHVMLLSSTAFASHWMIPRLPAFRLSYPDIAIHLQTTDRDTEIGPSPSSIGIRLGTGDWPNHRSTEMAKEIIFPVCSPSYLQEFGTIRDLHDLTTRKLIHLDEPHRPRPSWEEWFASTGFHYQGSGDGLRLNDYGLVVQAAIGGQGIALGWSHIVDHPTSEGLLVPAFEQQWVTGLKFFVVHHAAVQLSQEAETVKDWIVRGGTLLPKP